MTVSSDNVTISINEARNIALNFMKEMEEKRLKTAKEECEKFEFADTEQI